MSKIQHRYEKEDEIPKEHRALFTEVNGGWELTEVDGLKTQGDVDRLQASLTAERNDHTTTKTALGDYKALGTIEELTEKIDQIPVLQADLNAKGSGDGDFKAAVEEGVNARLAAELAPIKRENTKLTAEVKTLTTQRDDLATYKSDRMLEDAVRPAMRKLSVLTEHEGDVMNWAEKNLEKIDGPDGEPRFVAKAEIDGVQQGSDPRACLEQLLPHKPGWFPADVSGNAKGSNRTAAPAKNPWRPGGTIEERSRYFEEHGADAAAQAAQRAGVPLGSVPTPAPGQ